MRCERVVDGIQCRNEIGKDMMHFCLPTCDFGNAPCVRAFLKIAEGNIGGVINLLSALDGGQLGYAEVEKKLQELLEEGGEEDRCVEESDLEHGTSEYDRRVEVYQNAMDKTLNSGG